MMSAYTVPGGAPMTLLARKLRLIDYFALGFGVTVGTAWLVTMDDLLQRGGSLGAILGFAAGGLMLLPIGYVYGQLVKAIPDSAAEVAYTAKFFLPGVTFATGAVMFLKLFLALPVRALDYSVAIMLTIVASIGFYCFVIAAVAYVAPWPTLNHKDPFPTAAAFERAVRARWIVDLIMASALVAVLKTFNGTVVASSRLLFAMSRRNLLNQKIAYVHPVNQTPSNAVIAVGIATALAIFLG